MENKSAEVSWLDRDIQRFKKTGNLIPPEQLHIYSKIRDHWVSGRTVIDVGSSIGFGSNILSHEARHVWGVDIAPEAVKFAESTFARPNLSFEVLDIENPPSRPISKFEVVVCIEVIEHLANPEAGLATIKSFFSSKLNTIGFITVPNINHPRVGPADAKNPLHLNHWTPGEFYELMTKHFNHVTLFSGSRKTLKNWTADETVDGSDTNSRIIIAKLEGAK